MAIRVKLLHKTHYKFDRPVNVGPHVLRLRPAPHSRTKIHGYSLKVLPKGHFLNWQQDPFGNYQARLVFPEKTRELGFEVEVIADMTAINPFDFFVEDYAENFPFEYDKQLKKELLPYLEKEEEDSPLLTAWLATIDRKKKMRIIDFLVMLNSRLQQEIGYNIRMEPGVQSCQETLEIKRGSCRDTGWLMVQILRHLGLAARFTSGYLVQLTADKASLDGPSGPEADFTDLHAWCEVYVPGAGWVGLDPTSGLFASEGHIPLACTPHPVSAAPVTGATDKCEVEFSYSNEVFRIHEDPRVTKPYAEGDWETIKALGHAVDEELAAAGVKLTMGGEPTFVSVDDMESAQWNTDALGDDKLRLAKDLLLRLRARYAPDGLLHYGQGKWYPGEEVPRWALGVFWRTDGQAMWHNPELLARVDKDYGFGVAEAEQFGKALATRLGLAESYVQTAYEDTLHYLDMEEQLPINIDPLKADLKDGLERKRLAKLLRRGLNTPTGFALPLAWDYGNSGWMSTHWEFRRGHLALIPGDSPMGFRLPLDSLPHWDEKELRLYREPERDPFETRPDTIPTPELTPPEIANQITAPYIYTDEYGTISPGPRQLMTESADATLEERFGEHNYEGEREEIVRYLVATLRTTLCIEPRDGRIHLFLPPMQYLEHYVNLIWAIENTAAQLQMPVVIEGYEPPRDHRLQKLLVTPDPGVIEVNIHPSKSWGELVDNTCGLYEEAFFSRLGTDAFMVDGRHTGTGGGNHITLGGASPAESPILQRPDILRSFVTYWQHHPALSYMFSGMFIGPTSQAPRVDEGRDEMLYELEIAFQQMPDGEVTQPWLVDRLMRNLLIDITGNTHRAEFCIDKLYAPGTSSGRQGILEFRGFEMPPHEHMALVQALLIRSLFARFWKSPYKKPLVRWGTELHDKFMLPHYAWADMREVVDDLNRHGFPFQLEWLAPFEEFRYPHYGRVQIDDIELELRWAIEPWHVLGEEIASFGTARYVDSSVERLQIKVSGLTDSRYVVACNGRRVPLRPTGRHGEYVAGVRYRAWAPPSALHPTIGIHAPLTFDLIDTWNGLAIGGCSYHVSHQGGLSYDDFPVNAIAAETRRTNRFEDFNHTQGPFTPRPEYDAIREFFPSQEPPRPMAPPPEEPTHEYPHTLDLRRQSRW
ncbi:transglutaminase family protein [Halioxenophilus sp. WMMB6]|uniref:transglutaminase family protein n=1 Tax=Halioxenophilus sp. WMMB6 TaxID=3073815 RepID=UPI00295F1B19|nr:transglutaminase family protein [Halioxenophilus sp. WMMB6]